MSILKIGKKFPIFDKISLLVCISGLNSHLKCSFKSNLEKSTKHFPCGSPLLYVVHKMFIEMSLLQENCSVLCACNSHLNFSSKLLFQYLDFCKFIHLQKNNSWQYKPCILKTKNLLFSIIEGDIKLFVHINIGIIIFVSIVLKKK